MTELEVNTELPSNIAGFCSIFPPSARLCRILNRRVGTLLDVQSHPGLKLEGDNVPRVVCNPENSQTGVQYWLITPHGNGQAIIPVPKDGTPHVRYLTPSTSAVGDEAAVTLSPFPSPWIVLPTAKTPPGVSFIKHTPPQGLYEEWACLITWPHFVGAPTRVLNLHYGLYEPDSPVGALVEDPSRQWHFWLIQFVRHTAMVDPLPIPPSTGHTGRSFNDQPPAYGSFQSWSGTIVTLGPGKSTCRFRVTVVNNLDGVESIFTGTLAEVTVAPFGGTATVRFMHLDTLIGNRGFFGTIGQGSLEINLDNGVQILATVVGATANKIVPFVGGGVWDAHADVFDFQN